jgi:hypothetical protein
MTISLYEAVYEKLCRTIEKRRISQFIEQIAAQSRVLQLRVVHDLVRPHVVDKALNEGYEVMNHTQKVRAGIKLPH